MTKATKPKEKSLNYCRKVFTLAYIDNHAKRMGMSVLHAIVACHIFGLGGNRTHGRSNSEVVGSILTEVKIIFSLHRGAP